MRSPCQGSGSREKETWSLAQRHRAFPIGRRDGRHTTLMTLRGGKTDLIYDFCLPLLTSACPDCWFTSPWCIH
ncbi:hypothetical protein RRG08_009769 [Elysia crispata]|uniref:Uncharacterized protein n=1 Tax=Elysia crispata TaxID=231223 RepID=A0AAE1DKH9_9GAST|nr:hypothetical protein RRG08_009769 [Elysia crispata]